MSGEPQDIGGGGANRLPPFSKKPKSDLDGKRLTSGVKKQPVVYEINFRGAEVPSPRVDRTAPSVRKTRHYSRSDGCTKRDKKK